MSTAPNTSLTNARALRLQVLAGTWLAYAGMYMGRRVFGVVKLPLKQVLGVDDFALSHLWTTFLITYMLGQFAVAHLGRRTSSRTLLIAGLLCSGFSSAAMGVVMRWGQAAYFPLLILMALHGLGQATGWANCVQLIGRWTPRHQRGRVMGVWSTCCQFGAIAGKSLAAFLLGWGGLLWPFLGAAAVLFSVAAIFLKWGHESPATAQIPNSDQTAISSEPDPSNSEPNAAAFPAIFKLALAMGMTYACIKFLRDALDSWTAIVVAERFGLTATASGYLTTILDLTGFGGALLAGFLSDRMRNSARTPIVFATTLGLLLSLLLLWSQGLQSTGTFMLALGIVGFFLTGPDSLLSGAGAMDLGVRGNPVVTIAIVNGLGSAGSILEEPLIGWLKSYVGVDAVFGALVTVATLATAATAGLHFATRAIHKRSTAASTVSDNVDVLT